MPKGKSRQTLSAVSKDNKAERYAWAKKYRNYTLTDWRQWVISDETKVNMWGTDGNSFVWSDGDNTLLPHQMEPHVQGCYIKRYSLRKYSAKRYILLIH